MLDYEWRTVEGSRSRVTLGVELRGQGEYETLFIPKDKRPTRQGHLV